jgi:hypothetical protein
MIVKPGNRMRFRNRKLPMQHATRNRSADFSAAFQPLADAVGVVLASVGLAFPMHRLKRTGNLHTDHIACYPAERRERHMNNPNGKILVFENETPIRKFLRISLEAHGNFIHESRLGRDGSCVPPCSPTW